MMPTHIYIPENDYLFYMTMDSNILNTGYSKVQLQQTVGSGPYYSSDAAVGSKSLRILPSDGLTLIDTNYTPTTTPSTFLDIDQITTWTIDFYVKAVSTSVVAKNLFSVLGWDTNPISGTSTSVLLQLINSQLSAQYGKGVDLAVVNTTLTTGTWHHIVFKRYPSPYPFTSAPVELFKDDVSVGTDTCTEVSIPGVAYRTIISTNLTPSDTSETLLDDLKVSRR